MSQTCSLIPIDLFFTLLFFQEHKKTLEEVGQTMRIERTIDSIQWREIVY
ncbi:unnamed protein product [Paramecium sonneborni]|uniref:Uncharacterized protein n=1 Tax=Paramecium sonneborni TaxID=65129 RepID=A0A8S1RR70_9CILI|nr:unnamed protein product [Paramecium sonneborni]